MNDSDATVNAVLHASTAYDVLGCSPNSDPQVVDRAYRARCLALHPDKTSAPKAREAFQRVVDSYDALRSPSSTKNSELDRLALALVALYNLRRTAVCCLRCSANAPVGSAGLCGECERSSVPKCLQCGIKLSSGSQCGPCMLKSTKVGRCSRLGCLNMASSDVCDTCLTRPRKCAKFGCLRKVSPPATTCDRHSEGSP